MNRDDNLCWYHGRLSRDDAEQILRDGMFCHSNCDETIECEYVFVNISTMRFQLEPMTTTKMAYF